MRKRTLAIALAAGSAAALSIAGCYSSGAYSTATRRESGFVAHILVESVAVGGAVKLNGMLHCNLPGYVVLPVDPAGILDRPYTITLSTNIIDRELAQVFLEAGDPAPNRIFFNRTGPEITGTALPRPAK